MGVDRAIDITAKERKIVLDLLQRYLPGVEAWVYGSRAKWTSRPQSDLDLVVFATPEQSRRVGDLREGFEESNLPFRVDLFVWSEVPKQFHHEIERDHVVLMKVVPVSVDVNWPIITLGDCIDINDSTYSPKEAWSFVNYLDTGNITENCISEIQHLKTGIDTLPSRARRKVRPGDIVYSTVRPNQKHFGYLKKVPENFLVSTGFSVIRGISGVACTNYIYWFLAQSHIVDHLHTVAEHSTSAYPSIRPTDIERLTLRLPPISEQRTIAYILGTLDDKIELNRRMNETLEAMAHALFKSWFVDFDPVRAKMALNHSPPEGESQKPSRQATADVVGGHHSPLEGESQSDEPPGDSGCGGGTNRRSPQASRWGEIKRSYSEKTLNRAKSLRQNQTDAEVLLWHYLRNKQLDGYKFRRQQPIGPYIIDFACLPEKLLIELDGGQHAEREGYDEQRDRFLQSKGYRVLRFWNNEVFENCFDVLEQIYQALTSPDYSPHEGEPTQTTHHSPIEGESANQGPVPGLTGERQPASAPVGKNVLTSNYQVAETDAPPPHQPSPHGSPSATPPQGGSDWTVERARAYLDRMDPKIADLFPDRLVDSELGEIPEGWTTILIKQLGRVVTGKTPSTKKPEFFGTEVPFLKIPDMHGRIYVIRTLVSLSEEGAMSQAHKTVPAGSVSVSCIATPGLVVLNHRDTQTNQQINSIIPTDHMQSHFIFWSCRRLAAEVMLGGSGGSVFHNMNKTSFENLRLIYPSEEIARTYSKTVIQIHNRALSNEYETDTLAQIRDTLLPKLISGEIRLREAGETVEVVA